MGDIVERLRYQAGVIGSSVVGDPLVASLNRAADEIERLRAEVTPPEGCEAVFLPTESVDEWADHPGEFATAIACREAVARRPKPEPRTERVPWWEAVGRRLAMPMLHVEDATIREAAVHEDGRVSLSGVENPDGDDGDSGEWTANFWPGQHGFDGTVEVLVEDGDR